MTQRFLARCLLGALLVASPAYAEEADFARQVSRLVRQLNDDAAAQRDAAEQALVSLAGSDTASVDRLLAVLPTDSEQLPLAVRDRLARIRRQVEERAAKEAIAPTTVTLAAKSIPVVDVLQAIEQQTGNKAVDHRQQGVDEGAANEPRVTVDFKDEPYWSAVDKLLDEANLGIYSYAGDDALAIVEREPGDGPRFGNAFYGGPFRIEALEVQSQRNMRKPNQTSLKLQLEVAWEPRLRPIAVSQTAADLLAVVDGKTPLKASQPEAVFGAEVSLGTQAVELVLPFDLPARDSTKISSLKGKLRALVPGRQAKFKFDDLTHVAGKSQRHGGVKVAIDAVRKNNEIWEIHMRLRLDEDNHALESHRGWAFDNRSYLVNGRGETIENAGLETTSQAKNEVGVAYFFDVPHGLDGLTWVYESPAAIVELPIDYELNNVELP
jgi:hypothetical protein